MSVGFIAKLSLERLNKLNIARKWETKREYLINRNERHTSKEKILAMKNFNTNHKAQSSVNI